MKEKIMYQGDLFQIIKRDKKYLINSDVRCKVDLQYELVERPPGVRAIICKDNLVLLNKEFRYELNDWDYRLPGGKVFDSFAEYDMARKNGLLQKSIIDKLKSEIIEEADIIINSYDLFYLSHNGLTVEWDLYYYIVKDFSVNSNFYEENIQKSEFEFIEHCWLEYDQIEKLILEGKISEDRSVGVLLRYLLMLNKKLQNQESEFNV